VVWLAQLLVALVFGSLQASPTVIGSTVYAYDGATVARVEVRSSASTEVAPGEFSDAPQHECASPAIEGLRTLTTPDRSVTATNTVDDAAGFVVDSAGNATLRAQGPSGWIQVSEHAAEHMTQRGISINALDSALAKPSFPYWHEGVWKTGYYDPVTKVFAGTVNDTVTTVINKASQNYINNLKAVTPP
jgi:hypothetical protein